MTAIIFGAGRRVTTGDHQSFGPDAGLGIDAAANRYGSRKGPRETGHNSRCSRGSTNSGVSSLQPVYLELALGG